MSERVRKCEGARVRGRSPTIAPPHRRTIALSFVLASASGALAQTPPDEGPLVITPQQANWKAVQLVRLDAALDLWGQWRRDELKQQGQRTIKESETDLRETLDLSGEVYFGHKNLVDLSGVLKLGFEQESFHTDDQGVQSNSFNVFTGLFDLNALVLGNGPVPTNVYAKRDETYSHQDFGGSIKTTTTEFGALAQMRSAVIPTQVQVFHRDQEQSELLGGGGFNYTQDSAIVHSDARLTSNQHLLLDYTFDHIDEHGTFGINDNYNQHDATATHTLTFGKGGFDWLRSSLHILDRDGLFPEQTVRLDEDLFLQHTPRLESRYRLAFEDSKRGDSEQRQARGSALIRHRLFDSLTSTGTLSGAALDVPDEFHSEEVTLSGALDYTKRVPLGRFNANVALAGTRQQNSERGTTVSVSNGTFVFNDPFPVTINRRNIVPSSIIVRDASRIRVYISGVDYTVQVFPDRAELHRVVGGAIANGQAVSVDYDIGPEPGNTVDSTTGAVSLRYDITEGALSGLGVYGIFRKLDQSIDTAQPEAFVLDNYDEYRYGIDYHIGGATFNAERVNHNSTVSPFDANRFTAQYDRRFSRNDLLTVGLSWEDLSYRLTGQQVELFLGTARWSKRIGENFDFSLHTEARQEYHNDSPDIRGLDGGLDISWHKRQTTIYASMFASYQDAGSTTTTSETFSVGLKRAF